MAELTVETVLGPVSGSELGRTLMHEHLLVDFIGAARIAPGRYDEEEALRRLLPFLQAVRKQGFQSFVECTPMYLGRNPVLFRRLSEAAEVHVVINTGLYAAGQREGEPEPFLPRYAFDLPAGVLAGTWLKEWFEGMGGTGIRPGFVKTGVNPGGTLRPVSEKVVRAAAITSRYSGLAVACHTVDGSSALRILDIFAEEHVPADRYIYVHAQGEKDRSYHRRCAERGAWVELDGISPKSASEHAVAVLELLEAGFENRILISQDAGWFRPGEPNGGEIRGFTYLWEEFVPLLRERGVPDGTIDHLLVHNPREALTLRPRNPGVSTG